MRTRTRMRATLKGLVTSQLVEPTISATKPLAEILGFAELEDTYLVDLQWFQSFPPSIPMACALEAYLTIEGLA